MVPLNRFAGSRIGGRPVWGRSLFAIAALLGAAVVLSAQDKPPSAASTAVQNAAAQNAEKRANEWSILASNLEQRIARLLPCDPRVRSAIEEVSRASDARIAAENAYWQEIATRSTQQAEAARLLIADNDLRVNDWKSDRSDADQEQNRLATETSDLRDSARQQPALASAARALNGISQNASAAAKEAATRDDAASKLNASLHELMTATQARQAAIDAELKALAAESVRWSAYYAARIARAQLECTITGPAAGADPAPRPPAKKAP